MTYENQLSFFNLGSYLKWVQGLIKVQPRLLNQNLTQGVFLGARNSMK